MAKYIDGFVFSVPKKNLVAYRKMAKEGAKAWKKFGALEYFECMGDDPETKDEGMGKTRSFVDLTKAKEDDTVWFSFIIFKNKKHRDMVNKKVQEYFGKKYAQMKDWEMPFDTKKMAVGGFIAEVVG
jgi:uncharacterized protein YbaA (DUF1428 family)